MTCRLVISHSGLKETLDNYAATLMYLHVLIFECNPYRREQASSSFCISGSPTPCFALFGSQTYAAMPR
jgi:hypothetical protein